MTAVKSTTCDKLTFPAFAGVILIKIFYRLCTGCVDLNENEALIDEIGRKIVGVLLQKAPAERRVFFCSRSVALIKYTLN